MSKELKLLVDEFLPFAKKRFGYDQPVSINFTDDVNNAADPMGKTAYYDPSNMSITVFVTDRHPKDILRSLSHELVHHAQNCRGEFGKLSSQDMGEGYAQDNPHLREMEIEAFREGSMCLRDWSDRRKKTSYNESLLQGVNKNMSINEKKRRNVGTLLTEKWGFSFNMLNESVDEGRCNDCRSNPCGCQMMGEGEGMMFQSWDDVTAYYTPEGGVESESSEELHLTPGMFLDLDSDGLGMSIMNSVTNDRAEFKFPVSKDALEGAADDIFKYDDLSTFGGGHNAMQEAKKDDVALAYEKYGTSSRMMPDSEINSIESFNDWRMALPNPNDWEDAQSHRGGRILAYHRMDAGKPVGKYYDVQSDMYVSDDEMMDILPEGEMPDKNNNDIPDFAEDGEGENDMGKAADLEEGKGRKIKHPHSDKVEIRFDRDYEEYVVKKIGADDGEGYHTDDKEDAMSTAAMMAKEDMNEMSGVAAVAGHVDPRKQALREKVAKMVEEALSARLNNKEGK